jgi:hypothetical protein
MAPAAGTTMACKPAGFEDTHDLIALDELARGFRFGDQ